MSRHRATKDENRLTNPTIIGTRIKYFWIYDANLNNNVWITGVVTKEKENMKGYYIVKFPTFPGRATKIIVPLTNEKFHTLWRRCDEQDDEDDEKVESSCSTTPSASSVRTWIQCTRKGCTNWVQLPVGLHRICKTFCCTDASLWGKVLETCANPKPTKIKVVEQLVRKRPAPAAPAELSAYETLRLKNVQRNQEFLSKLGLSSARSHPAVAESVGGSDSRTPSKKKRKKTKRGDREGTTPVVMQRKSERSRKARSFLRDEETDRSKKKAKAIAARFVEKSSAQYHISELLSPPSLLLLLPFWWSWSRCNKLAHTF